MPFGSPVESQGGLQEGRKQVYAGPTRATISKGEAAISKFHIDFLFLLVSRSEMHPEKAEGAGGSGGGPCKAIGKPIKTLLNYASRRLGQERA